MKMHRSGFGNQASGFTLIETAISLVILGIILAPLLVLYGNYREREKLSVSYENVYQAVDTLQNFRRMNGYYPCPAPMSVDRADAGYGRATACKAAPFDTTVPGNCVNGLCVENSVRAAALAVLTPPASPRVLVGAVPFRDLQIDEEDTYDAYGGRLYYAITESMTDIVTINDNNGAIAVRNDAGNPLATPDGSAGFVVFHTGPTQKGAYSRDGVLIEACAGAELDIENCNDGFSSGAGTSVNAVYVASSRNDSAGATYYDDEIVFFSQITEPTWKRTVANPEDIEELSPNFVGVGTAGPGTDMDIRSATTGNDSLYVNGATGLPGAGGTLVTDTVCDETASDCFAPALIAGDANALPATGGMLCGAGTYMSGIENGGPRCEAIAIVCPDAAPVLTGFDGAGNPNCVALPGASCPAETRTVCGANDVSLAAAIDTTLSAFFNLGACRNVRYRCNGGTWGAETDTGSCVFVPVVTTSDPIDCGTGYTGTYTTTTTTSCSGGGVTTDTFAANCVCTGATVNETENCSVVSGGSWTGTATRTVTYSPPSCAPDNPAWDTSGCICAAPILETLACSHASVGLGPAWSGNATRTITRSGPACTPDSPAWDISGCTCDTTPVITYADHACANPVCEEPDPADRDQYTATINPTTCAQNAPALTHTGTCRPKAFKWIDINSTGVPSPSLPPGARFKGDGCSCADHADTTGANTKTCYYATDPSRTIYNCKCQ